MKRSKFTMICKISSGFRGFLIAALCAALAACGGGGAGSAFNPPYLEETEAGFQQFLTENQLPTASVTVVSEFISASGHMCKKFTAINNSADAPARIACGAGKNQSWKEVRSL